MSGSDLADQIGYLVDQRFLLQALDHRFRRSKVDVVVLEPLGYGHAVGRLAPRRLYLDRLFQPGAEVAEGDVRPPRRINRAREADPRWYAIRQLGQVALDQRHLDLGRGPVAPA